MFFGIFKFFLCFETRPTITMCPLRARSEKNAALETSAKINNEVSRDSVRPRGCSVTEVSRDCGRIRPRSPLPKVRSRENLQILVFLETEVSKM